MEKTKMNQVAQRQTAEKFCDLLIKANMKNFEVAEGLGINPPDLSWIKNPKFYHKVSARLWEVFRIVVNSGDDLPTFLKKHPDGVSVEVEPMKRRKKQQAPLNSYEEPVFTPIEINWEKTPRGFIRATFFDVEDNICTIQESSRVDLPLWVGILDPQILIERVHNENDHAGLLFPIKTPEGWIIKSRMHLNRDQAAHLGLILLEWARTGKLQDIERKLE